MKHKLEKIVFFDAYTNIPKCEYKSSTISWQKWFQNKISSYSLENLHTSQFEGVEHESGHGIIHGRFSPCSDAYLISPSPWDSLKIWHSPSKKGLTKNMTRNKRSDRTKPSKSSQPKVLNINKKLTTNNYAIATAFNTFFNAVTGKIDEKLIPATFQ